MARERMWLKYQNDRSWWGFFIHGPVAGNGEGVFRVEKGGPWSLIDQLPEFMYTYILPKTNEISFNTHLLVIAYYVYMYSVTL